MSSTSSTMAPGAGRYAARIVEMVGEPVDLVVRFNFVGLIRTRGVALLVVIAGWIGFIVDHRPVWLLLSAVLFSLLDLAAWAVLRRSAPTLRVGTNGGFFVVTRDSVHVIGAGWFIASPTSHVTVWPRWHMTATADGGAAWWPLVRLDVPGEPPIRVEISANGKKDLARADLLAALSREGGRTAPRTAAVPGPSPAVASTSTGERVRVLSDAQKTELAAVAPPEDAAGWYADPFEQGAQRFWNGDQWTGRTRPSTS